MNDLPKSDELIISFQPQLMYHLEAKGGCAERKTREINWERRFHRELCRRK